METTYWSKLYSSFESNSKKIRSFNILITITIPLIILAISRLRLDIAVIYTVVAGILFIYSFICGKKLMGNNKFAWWSYPILFIFIPIVASYVVRWMGDDITSGIVVDTNPQQLQTVDRVDLGYSIFSSIRSGSEEVWRYTAMFSLMYIFRISFNKLYSFKLMKYIFLIFSFLISSFIFGWIHTLGYSSSYFDFDVIIVTGVSGFLFGLVMIVSRSVWTAILTHILYNLHTIFRLYERSAFEKYNDVLTQIAFISFFFYVCAVIVISIKNKPKVRIRSYKSK